MFASFLMMSIFLFSNWQICAMEQGNLTLRISSPISKAAAKEQDLFSVAAMLRWPQEILQRPGSFILFMAVSCSFNYLRMIAETMFSWTSGYATSTAYKLWDNCFPNYQNVTDDTQTILLYADDESTDGRAILAAKIKQQMAIISRAELRKGVVAYDQIIRMLKSSSIKNVAIAEYKQWVTCMHALKYRPRENDEQESTENPCDVQFPPMVKQILEQNSKKKS